MVRLTAGRVRASPAGLSAYAGMVGAPMIGVAVVGGRPPLVALINRTRLGTLAGRWLEVLPGGPMTDKRG